jgi:hypothetical protein
MARYDQAKKDKKQLRLLDKALQALLAPISDQITCFPAPPYTVIFQVLSMGVQEIQSLCSADHGILLATISPSTLYTREIDSTAADGSQCTLLSNQLVGAVATAVDNQVQYDVSQYTFYDALVRPVTAGSDFTYVNHLYLSVTKEFKNSPLNKSLDGLGLLLDSAQVGCPDNCEFSATLSQTSCGVVQSVP